MNTIYKVKLIVKPADPNEYYIEMTCTLSSEITAEKIAKQLASSMKSLPGYTHTVELSQCRELPMDKIIL